MNRKKANFTLPLHLIERLKMASDNTFLPQARIVEMALVAYLPKLEDQVVQELAGGENNA